ncbi:MAG: hypothetical protein COY80_04185 [Candidatus Pacebacteria bacterium CG_4_10_14_0_8_um_filter_42_14]|nr:MAG: hypothetical protein COY80_04185 [Candidatus Pacebacteria bacterium CG_4_10_14_0_8_um_filter_42_14]
MDSKRQITIVTASELAKEQRQDVQALLKKKLGLAEIIYVIDPRIVGGVQLNVDGQELDASILGELQKLDPQLPKVVITSAVALSSDERKLLHNLISDKIGPAQYQENVDRSCIGGLKIIVGDKEYDGTIQGKLANLRRTLLKKTAGA